MSEIENLKVEQINESLDIGLELTDEPVKITGSEDPSENVEVVAAEEPQEMIHSTLQPDTEKNLSLEAKVEAIVFASPKPVKPSEIAVILQDENLDFRDIQTVLDNIKDFYEKRSSGFKLEYIKGLGYQFQTVTEAGPIMEKQFASRPRPITRAAMETLAIIAYRQPVTRAEIEYIRGVDTGGIIKTLLDKNLINCVGRREDAGRPMLFGTTDEFLKVFRLTKIRDLPTLDSFQPPPELLKNAGISGNVEVEVDIEKFIGKQEKERPEGAVLAEPGEISFVTEENVSEDINILENAAAETPVIQTSEDLSDLTEGQNSLDKAKDDGKETDSEVDLGDGDRLEKGSGTLDQ